MVWTGDGADACGAGAAWPAPCQDRAAGPQAGKPGFGGPLRVRALLKRQSGALVRQDGSLMRASTGCTVGSDGDRLIEVVAADVSTVRLRVGTRVAGETGEVTVSALIVQAGEVICAAARRQRAPQ